MTATSSNLFTRDDTLLGVCEGFGEEFGFNANALRVVLAALLLWNAWVVVGGYLTAGVVLAVARWVWPVRRTAVTAVEPVVPVAENDEGAPLAQAA